MKKLISTLLLLATLMQLLAIPTLAEDKDGSEYWNTMVSFGVVESGQSKSETFTVAEMSKMIYDLLNIRNEDVPEATRQIYTDVDRWHWAAGYIEWLYNNRVYTGDGSGMYEPDRAAKLSDICTVTLNLLGYTDMMKNTADNTSVINKAVQIGLLSSKVNKSEHELTYDEAASVFYELLFTNVIEPVYTVKKAYTKGGEFITEVLDVEYGKGILMGANGYSLSNKYCDIDEVMVDGNKYELSENIDYTDYLGYKVKYYFVEEDKEAIAVIPLKNSELVINSADIVSYRNGVYTYEVEDRRKTELCDNGVLLLYNGKITTNRNAFTPTYGRVRLIDNDNDGRYECVISEDAVNIVLEKVVGGIVYGKNTDSLGQKYAFDIEDYELVRFVGNSVKPEELKENTVISVVTSEDGEYVTFYVSEKKVTGTFDGYDDGKIVVAGEKYEQAANMFNPNVITTPGVNVDACVDVFGSIAAILGANDNKFLFGYLMSVREDVMENKLILKIMSEEGGILSLYTSDRLVIDGIRMETTNAAKLLLNVDEVIRYRVSNGEIKAIDTANQNSGYSNLNVTSDRDALTMIAKGDVMLYKASPRIFKYYGTAMQVHAEFGLDENTVVFFVPKNIDPLNEKEYYVGTMSSIRDDAQPAVQAYVTGNDALVAEAVVVKYTTSITLSTSFAMVEKVITTVDEDNEIVGRIKGICNGKEIDVVVKDLSLLDNIGKGSIIRYQTDRDGIVKEISNIYGLNGTGTVNTSTTHSWTSGASGVNANVRAVVGYVYDKSGTIARFKFKDAVAQDELFNLKNCNIYVYDTSNDPVLRMGTIDDLYDYKHHGTKCDEVIICTRAVNVSDVFLIKK